VATLLSIFAHISLIGPIDSKSSAFESELSRASRLRSKIALHASLCPLKNIGVLLRIVLLSFADLKILDSRLADDGKTTIQTATKSH
jgi:hypothetical protein